MKAAMSGPVANTPKDVVQTGIRSSLIGVIVNLVLAGAKCLAGIVGHSFALVADGIESLGDVVSSSIAWSTSSRPEGFESGLFSPVDILSAQLAICKRQPHR
jgi:Co/Zn/Cd efflux system component